MYNILWRFLWSFSTRGKIEISKDFLFCWQNICLSETGIRWFIVNKTDIKYPEFSHFLNLCETILIGCSNLRIYIHDSEYDEWPYTKYIEWKTSNDEEHLYYEPITEFVSIEG